MRYLWIDAHCIVQDDSEDWAREAATMCDDYWNTVYRLAVSDSKCPTEGFFHPAPVVESVRITSLEPEGQRRRDSEKVRHNSRAEQVDNTMNSLAMDKIQSTIDKTSEFTPIGLFPESNFNYNVHTMANLGEHSIWLQRDPYKYSDNQAVPGPRLRICESFSQCRLSFDTDRLAAISRLVVKKQQFSAQSLGSCPSTRRKRACETPATCLVHIS